MADGESSTILGTLLNEQGVTPRFADAVAAMLDAMLACPLEGSQAQTTERATGESIGGAEAPDDDRRLPTGIAERLVVAGSVLGHGGSESQVITAVLADPTQGAPLANRHEEVAGRFGAEVAAIVAERWAWRSEYPAGFDGGRDDGAQSEMSLRRLARLADLVTEDNPAVLVLLCTELHHARHVLADVQAASAEDATSERARTAAVVATRWFRDCHDLFATADLPHRAVREFATLVELLEALLPGQADEAPDPGLQDAIAMYVLGHTSDTRPDGDYLGVASDDRS